MMSQLKKLPQIHHPSEIFFLFEYAYSYKHSLYRREFKKIYSISGCVGSIPLYNVISTVYRFPIILQHLIVNCIHILSMYDCNVSYEKVILDGIGYLECVIETTMSYEPKYSQEILNFLDENGLYVNKVGDILL